MVEEVDYTALRGSNDYGTISSSAMAVVSNDWNINYESVRDQAPVNLSGSATADPADPNSKLIFVHAPEQDMDVVIEMQGAGGADYDGVNYPAEKTKIVDVVGAGDTFLAALVYFHLLYGNIEEAIPFANKAAAIAVQNFGTYVLTEEDVQDLRN